MKGTLFNQIRTRIKLVGVGNNAYFRSVFHAEQVLTRTAWQTCTCIRVYTYPTYATEITVQETLPLHGDL